MAMRREESWIGDWRKSTDRNVTAFASCIARLGPGRIKQAHVAIPLQESEFLPRQRELVEQELTYFKYSRVGKEKKEEEKS